MAKKRSIREKPGGDYTLTSLDQVRALADPLRLRLLGVFARGPHTTKQVAEALGEKPTRLYHHVEALERAGLLVLKETRPVRGATERYYQAVGTHFAVPDTLLRLDESAERECGDLFASIFDATKADLAKCAGLSEDCEGGPLVVRALLTGSPERLRELRAELAAWLERVQKDAAREIKKGKGGMITFALTLAFYPVPTQEGR